MNNTQDFLKLSIGIEKEWSDELNPRPDLIHVLGLEFDQHYPYIAYLDRSNSRIAFKNKNYKVLEKIKGKGNKIWFDFDCEGFVPLSKETTEDVFDGVQCERFPLQDDYNPHADKPHFVGYMSSLLEIERRMKEPSPFMFRYAFIVKSAYQIGEDKGRIKELEKEIKILKQNKKWYEAESKRKKHL